MMIALEHKAWLGETSYKPPVYHHDDLFCCQKGPISPNNTTTQRNYEASVKCLQNKGHPCSLQYNNTYIEGFPDLQDGLCGQPVGNVIDPNCLSNNESQESSKELTQQPIYHHDIRSWSTNPDINGVSVHQLNPFQNQYHPFAVNYRYQYAPVNMHTQNYPYDRLFQDFQYFVVIDFEATCDKEKTPHPQEIIEFPSVIVSSITGQLEACFQTYVRPTCNKVLSDFCKDLTGIQQIQVDRGVPLSEALLSHDKWLEKKGIKNTNFAVVTWSNWDCRVMLESECRYKKIRKPPYFNRWINLRVPFHEVFGGDRCNLKEAVEKSGLTWQGRAHCGLDDAMNTARLLALIMHKGFKFSFTNSLAFEAGVGSFSRKPTQDKPHYVLPQPQQKLQQLRPPPPQYHHYCHCGVMSSRGMVQKPGPKKGSRFFGCGNWTATRGARCHYFEWASP